MRTQEITMLSPKNNTDWESLFLAKGYIRDTKDTIVSGLLQSMANEIRHERYISGEKYLGSDSSLYEDCLGDAENLLARALLDHSCWPLWGFSKNSFRKDIETMAYFIWKNEGGQNSNDNWMMAQTRYARGILEEFRKRELQEEDKRERRSLFGRR